jgi:hypothetical protein
MLVPDAIVGSRYRVVRLLGGGGMKLVYLAQDLRLAARPCALAEMVDSFSDQQAQQQAAAAFQREANMLATLSNEHIPRVFDSFSEQNHHYLVMEHVEGVTLEQELTDAGGKLPELRLIDIALQILDTLEYLHNLNPPVIYRDLKPSNVMLTVAGAVKLIDFGIARHFQAGGNATMIGTQGYAPPEQYRGKVEFRSDLYALGATLHHALSGRDPAAEPPFSFPPLRKLCPALAPALTELIDQSLSYDLDRRVPSAGEFKRRLAEIRLNLVGGSTGNSLAYSAQAGSTADGNGGEMPGQVRGGAIIQSQAPTVLTSEPEIACPRCHQRVPADSRFCSYCAAELQLAPAPSASPEARTGPLGAIPPASVGLPRRHRGVRRTFALLIAAFAASFLLVRFISHLEATRSGFREGAGVPAPSVPSARPPAYASARLIALREALDLQGYRSVEFHMEGDTMILTGTVPTEEDRLMVQTIIFAVANVVSLEDHLQVSDRLAEP